jgi:electron transfer flavoprotein alpha subunit
VSGAIWIIGEIDDDRLLPSSTGVATLARQFGMDAGREVVGVVVGVEPEAAATELAAYVPRVLRASIRADEGWLTPSAAAPVIAGLVAEHAPSHLLVPATPGGKELAGALAALLQWGVLANAVDLAWDGRALVHTVIFKVDMRVRSTFLGDHGLITVQPNVVPPEVLATVGVVEEVAVPGATESGGNAAVRLVERVRIPAPASVEGARVVVAGGAGIGGADRWPLVQALADALDGAVGASRPAVDAGWVPFSQQVGQTGKSVRPDLYVALGISGEVQHRVGMRTAKTVVAVNNDPDAPIGQIADLFVVADLHEIVPGLVASIQERGAR